MASILFGGLASGLDTQAIVDAILSVERQPLERIQSRQQLYNQQKAAIDELNSKLNSFESALRDLAVGRAFRGRTASVSDESILRASPGTGAETGIFEIEVTQLAAAHKVKSDGFSASDEELVSEGTITLQSGGNDPIVIDVSAANGNQSLVAVRDAINDADAGVSASILFDGTDYLLTVRAEESGTANALTIDDTTNLSLGDPGNVVTAAQDASLVVDGITVTSSSNRITQTISGLTLDLLAETDPGGTVNVEVAQDNDGVVDAVGDLVSRYNELIDFFNQQFDRDNPGPLSGDSTVRSIQTKLQTLFTGGVEGIPLGGIRALSSIGVSFDGKTGKASLDSAELREILDTRFDEIGDLFVSAGQADHPRIQYVGASFGAQSGEYAVEITQAAAGASLVGASAINKLSRDEDLTITVGSDSVTVNLLKNQQLPAILDAINTELEAAGIDAVASDDGGRLRITTDEVGSEAEITVVSSTSQTGTRSTGFGTTPVTDNGDDVAGLIGGVEATGAGRILTAADDGPYAGIQVKVNATADDVTTEGGDFGSVFYTRGLVGNVLVRVEQYTRFGDGPLALAKEGLDSQIRSLDRDVDRIEDRLASREAQLLRAFAEAENAISALQSQQSTLGGFTVR